MYFIVLHHLLQLTLLDNWFTYGKDYNVAVNKLTITSKDKDNAGVL